jgi:hypothetical protein
MILVGCLAPAANQGRSGGIKQAMPSDIRAALRKTRTLLVKIRKHLSPL